MADSGTSSVRRRASPELRSRVARSKVSVRAPIPPTRVDHVPMRAMVLDAPGAPLRAAELPDPIPGPGEVLLDVLACGVCRTDLHIRDGELATPRSPLVLG